jgi:hypothetical protein
MGREATHELPPDSRHPVFPLPAIARARRQLAQADAARHTTRLRPWACRARWAYRAFTVAVGPLAFTAAMPSSRAAAVLYIWLVPMTWWLPAFRLK